MNDFKVTESSAKTGATRSSPNPYAATISPLINELRASLTECVEALDRIEEYAVAIAPTTPHDSAVVGLNASLRELMAGFVQCSEAVRRETLALASCRPGGSS